MPRVLLCIAVLLTSACMLAPYDGQVVSDRGAPLAAEGFYSSGNAPITLQAWNQRQLRWDTVRTTRSSAADGFAVPMFGSRWFHWQTSLNLGPDYWVSASRGAYARVKALNHISLPEEGRACMQDADAEGLTASQAAERCAGPNTPEARIYTEDFCPLLLLPPDHYRIGVSRRLYEDRGRVDLIYSDRGAIHSLGPGARVQVRFYNGESLLGQIDEPVGARTPGRYCYLDDGVEGVDRAYGNVEGWKVIRCAVDPSHIGATEPCRYFEFIRETDDTQIWRPHYSHDTRVEFEVTPPGCGGSKTYTARFNYNPGIFPCSCRDELYVDPDYGRCRR